MRNKKGKVLAKQQLGQISWPRDSFPRDFLHFSTLHARFGNLGKLIIF